MTTTTIHVSSCSMAIPKNIVYYYNWPYFYFTCSQFWLC